MTRLFIIGLGGFVGAVGRHGLSTFLHSRYGGNFPIGTLAVNVVGCLLIGFLLAWTHTRGDWSTGTRLLLATGLLGSFTTFSTFSYETAELLRLGSTRLALASVLANLVVGLTAVELGRWCARWASG